MRDHQHLTARTPSDGRQRLSHAGAHLAADALIHFVEHERGHRVMRGQDDFQRQHQPGQLPARRHAGERARVEADVELDLEHDVFGTLCAVRCARYDPDRKAPLRHP